MVCFVLCAVLQNQQNPLGQKCIFVHFTNRISLSEEDRENLLLLKCCYCFTIGREKKCVCDNDTGNKQRYIRRSWSQGENKVIALHLNLSADELSLEGKNIFAHERFIRNFSNHISVLSGFLVPSREGGRWNETSAERAIMLYVKCIYLLILLLGLHF